MEAMNITKRDLDKLTFNRELMRKANLTGPAGMVPGESLTFIRKFAQDSLMKMKAINPDAFRNQTVDTWAEAIKQYIMTRRPEFRQELVDKLKARYGGMSPTGEVPTMLMLGASDNVKGSDLIKKGALRKAGKK